MKNLKKLIASVAVFAVLAGATVSADAPAAFHRKQAKVAARKAERAANIARMHAKKAAFHRAKAQVAPEMPGSGGGGVYHEPSYSSNPAFSRPAILGGDPFSGPATYR